MQFEKPLANNLIGEKVLYNTKGRCWISSILQKSVATTVPQVGMDTSEDAETSEAQLLADIQVDEILGSPEFAGA